MLVLSVLSFLACKGAEAEEDPLEHACEQFAEAASPLSASATTDDAPAIDPAEEAYELSLVSGAVGYVEVVSTEDQAAILFVGTADVANELWLDGVQGELATPAPNDLCPDDIPEHFDLDLEPGTWHIGFGPAAVDSVWMLLLPAGSHAHEE